MTDEQKIQHFLENNISFGKNIPEHLKKETYEAVRKELESELKRDKK